MFTLTEMKNGLRIVTVPMKGMNSVSVGMWVKVGGRYEKDSLSGISHFIEHLVFKGTKKRNVKKIKEAIEGRGGALNAFTAEEATCYFVKILKKHLATAIDLVCDLAYNPLFKETDVEMERTVILEEIKMYMDLPSQYVHDLLNEVMWPGHPLGHSVLGSAETISKMTRADIRRYTREYYHNRNMLLMVCGDVTHEEVIREAHSHVNQRRIGASSAFSGIKVTQTEPKMHLIEKDTEQTHFVLGYHTCSRCDERRYVLALLNIILGANMSSRLFEEVREKRGLAYEIRSGISLFQDTGAFSISAGVENGKAHAALKIIMRELKKIADTKVSRGELRRAKDFYLGQLLLLFEGTMDNMLWYGEKILHRGQEGVPSIELITARIEDISSDEIVAMAQEIFTRPRTNFVAIGKVPAPERKKIEQLML